MTLAKSVAPSADVGRLAVGCSVQVYWREYEAWFDAVVKAYRDARHHLVYEDGQEDVGIIDGRSLWVLEDGKWTAMRIRWNDEDLQLAIDRPAEDKIEPDVQRDAGDVKNPSAIEHKEEVQTPSGGGPTSSETGFMIGCDMCDKWYYGWCVDITEHEAKEIKKYVCPKCVIEGARKRGGKGTNKRLRTVAAKMQT